MYALHVEKETRENDDYTALCDLSETVSCSKALSSEYARVFHKVGILAEDSILNVPNALFGERHEAQVLTIEMIETLFFQGLSTTS